MRGSTSTTTARYHMKVAGNNLKRGRRTLVATACLSGWVRC